MYRPFKSFWKSWIYSIVCSYVFFMQGLVGLLTFGFIIPEWEYRLIFWVAKLSLKDK